MISTKRWIKLGASMAIASLTWLAVGITQAQTYPNRPVTLMVPYPAGGVSDVIARTLNQVASKQLGQPVVIENLGGASGSIAAQKVLSSPADGHIFFQGSPNELILPPLAMRSVKYKAEDFRLVQMITINPLAVFTRKDLPVVTPQELLDYGKKQAVSGKPLTYASVGIGSLYHILSEHLSKQSNVPMTHIPYKGGADAVRAMLSGEVDFFITPYSKSMIQMVQEGKLKVVGILSSERQQAFPYALPVSSAPALKGFVYDIWAGFFVHKNTPEPIVQSLHKALSVVANDEQVRKSLEAQYMIVPRPQPLAAMSKIYADNTAKYRAIAKSIQLQAQ